MREAGELEDPQARLGLLAGITGDVLWIWRMALDPRAPPSNGARPVYDLPPIVTLET
jgi:hypothetical protein